MKRLLFLPLLALVLFSGCDSGGSGPPQLNGDYIVETQAQGAEVTFDVTLSESDQSLSGNGTFSAEDNDSQQAITADLDVEGSHDHPNARIEMINVEVEPNESVILEGEVSGGAEQISGTLTFPNGAQQEVTMRRE